MPLSPAERSLRASLAVHTMWSKCEDWTARTQPARDAFRESFQERVDPNCELDPTERAKRADQAYKAHFKRMALERSKKRRGEA